MSKIFRSICGWYLSSVLLTTWLFSHLLRLVCKCIHCHLHLLVLYEHLLAIAHLHESTNINMIAVFTLCSPRKNPYPPHRRWSEIPRGRRVLKVKLLEEKYEAKLEFPRGREGAKQETLCGGSMDIFWNCTLYDRQWSDNILDSKQLLNT